MPIVYMFGCACVCVCVCVPSSFSHVWPSWTVAHRASLSMGLSQQEYWSGLPCPPPGHTHVSCCLLGFRGGSDSKACACNVGDPSSIPGSRRSPREGNGNPLLPGKSHGQRSLVGPSPRGHKESDTMERLHSSVSCTASGVFTTEPLGKPHMLA